MAVSETGTLPAATAAGARQWSSLRSVLAGRAFVAVLIVVMFVLIVLPLLVLLLGSFLSDPPRALRFNWAGLTFNNYIEILTRGTFTSLLGTTLFAALLGTIGAVLIGTSLAWLAVRTDAPGRRMLQAVAIMPMFIPPLVGAFAWDILASPKAGIINIVLTSLDLPNLVNIYTMGGITFVFAIYYAPYVFLFISAALRNMDNVLEEAAAIAGASRVRTIFQITLPLIAPAVLSSALLVFVLLIELFAVPAVLAEPANIKFMSVRIYELIGFTPPRVNEASALGVVLVMMTVVLVLIQHRILARRSFITVSGKGLRPEPIPLGRARWPLAILGFSYIGFVVLLPYAALLFVAFRRNLYFSDLASMLDASMFSLRHFETVVNDAVIQSSLLNSLFVCLGTVTIGSALYFAISYIVNRTQLAGRRVLDMISVMPIAIPGLILGLGYLWSWISIPVGIYGTIWIIVFAFISQFSPQGTRVIAGSMLQIHPELEESSRLSGASFVYTLRRIVLPLAMPGILASMILLAVLSFRELSTALFLYTSRSEVFSVTMFDFWIRTATSIVACMAVIQTLVLLVIVVAGQRFLQFGSSAPPRAG